MKEKDMKKMFTLMALGTVSLLSADYYGGYSSCPGGNCPNARNYQNIPYYQGQSYQGQPYYQGQGYQGQPYYQGQGPQAGRYQGGQGYMQEAPGSSYSMMAPGSSNSMMMPGNQPGNMQGAPGSSNSMMVPGSSNSMMMPGNQPGNMQGAPGSSNSMMAPGSSNSMMMPRNQPGNMQGAPGSSNSMMMPNRQTSYNYYQPQENMPYQGGPENMPYQGGQENMPYQGQGGAYQYQQPQGGMYQAQGGAYQNAQKRAFASDDQIAKKVHNILGSGWFTKGYQNVTFDVTNGVVSLRGSVETSDDKKKIENNVKKIPGVKQVNNEITVTAEKAALSYYQPPMMSDGMDSDDPEDTTKAATATKYSKDFAATDSDKQINEKIRDKLSGGWFNKGYDNLVIRTTNGIVTVSGTVNKFDDIQKVSDEIKKVDGVKSVNNQLTVRNK